MSSPRGCRGHTDPPCRDRCHLRPQTTDHSTATGQRLTRCPCTGTCLTQPCLGDTDDAQPGQSQHGRARAVLWVTAVPTKAPRQRTSLTTLSTCQGTSRTAPPHPAAGGPLTASPSQGPSLTSPHRLPSGDTGHRHSRPHSHPPERRRSHLPAPLAPLPPGTPRAPRKATSAAGAALSQDGGGGDTPASAPRRLRRHLG